MKANIYKSLIMLLALFSVTLGKAQVNITSTTPVTEDFSSMSSGTTTPTGWKIQKSSTPTFAGGITNPLTAANSGSPATGAHYNWGNTAGTDRSLGVMTSGSFTSPNSVMVDYKNTSGLTMTQLSVSYDLKRYRRNSAAASVQFFYSTDGSTWQAATSGDIAQATIGTAASSSYVFGTPDVFSVSTFTITGLSIANNSDLYLRWNLNTTGTNSQGIGIDNVTVTATLATPSIAIATSHPSAANINQGSTDNIISAISLGVTTTNTTLSSVSLTTAGSFTSSDVTNFKLWLSSSSTSIASATQLGSTLTGISSGGTLSASSLSNALNSGSTYYIVATASIASGATAGNTVSTTSTAFSNITFASGNKTGTDPAPASNAQTIVAATPSITLANGTVGSGNITQSSTNNVLYRTDVTVATTVATLNSASFTTAGSYSASDISNLKLWYQTTSSFTGSGTLLGTLTTGLGTGSHTFSSLSQSFPVGTGYLFVTTDLPCATTLANTINVAAITTGNFTFASGTPTGSSFTAGGTQTISSGTAANATGAAAAATGNSGEVSVSWTNPAGCFDEIMIVAAPASNTGTPSGNGSSYTANLAYGSGTALGNGFVVYKGSSSPQVVTGLTNGTTYSFKIFTRTGTNWSAGTTDVTATPVVSATVTELIVPQYMQGGGGSNRIAYSCLLTINNLTPSATYRYFPTVVLSTDAAPASGAGNAIFASTGGFTRSASVSLSSAGNFGTFTTDASGSYTGWFITEPTGNARFTAGNDVFVRIIMNNGANGTTTANTVTTSSIHVVNFATSAGANNGSGLRGSSAATAKNFAVLYDNVNGSGRPLAAAFVESDGSANTTGNSYASFYGSNVDGVSGAYGVIVPNSNANGVRRIEQRSITSGAIVGCPSVDADGVWPSGVNTINPTSGTTALVITATDANLVFSASAQSQTAVSCNGGSDGTATVSLTGGNAAFVYSWSPSGGSAATGTSLSAGTYTCSVTDNIGCTASATFTIIQPTAISHSSSSTAVSCNGGSNGSATVTASGGTGTLTYSWAPSGGIAATASSLMAGTYTCTITDANSCTATETVTVAQPTALSSSISSSTNVSCNGGNNGSATVSASGGTPAYAYSWSPSGGTAATAGSLTAGTYTCTVTDANGCTSTSSVTITEPTALSSSISSSANVSCNGGNNGSATVSASGGTPAYAYSWSPSGGTAATASSLAAGTYTCTVTDANGCTSTSSVTITAPAAITTGVSSQTNVSCNGGNTGSATVSVSGGTPAYAYSWSPSGGTAATAGSLAAGTYTCTITDAGGCSATQTVTITEPAAISHSISSQTNVSCNGGTTGAATVMASGGTGAFTYAWAPSGGTAATASGLAAGTYTCTITDANNCTATQTVTITQPTQAMSANVASQTNVSCFGGNDGAASVSVSGGTPAYTFLWTPSGNTTGTISNLTAGAYTCAVTDANGCTASQTVTITQPASALAVNSSMTQSGCPNNNGAITLTVSGGTPAYAYSWSNGATTQNISGLAAGSYTVVVTDSKGCTSQKATTVTQNCTVPNTQMVSTQCGQTIPDLSGAFYCNTVTNAQDYEWEITNASGYFADVVRGLGVNSIAKTSFANLQFGQSYNVRVRCKVGGQWGNFSTSCPITIGTPLTQFLTSDCGRTFTDFNGWFYCNEIVGAQDYEWEFTNSGLGYSFTKVRNQATTSMLKTDITGLQFGQTYSVRVRSKVGGIWGSFGPTCTFTMGPIPTTKLIASLCGGTFNLSGWFYCDNISGAQDYEWEFTGVSTTYNFTLQRGAGISSLGRPAVTGLQNAQTYSVRVRAKVGGVWGTFGTSCNFTINTSSSTKFMAPEEKADVTVEETDFVAYPNPFNTTITIAVKGIENDAVNSVQSIVEVYNALGEKIYTAAPNSALIEIDPKAWSNGVYYVMLTQGDKRISKKILKQD